MIAPEQVKAEEVQWTSEPQFSYYKVCWCIKCAMSGTGKTHGKCSKCGATVVAICPYGCMTNPVFQFSNSKYLNKKWKH